MPTVQQELAALDLWELLSRCLGKPELAKRVLQRFRTQMADDLDRIQLSLNSGDDESAREVAHRLKGAAANVSAHALQEQAYALESTLKLRLTEQYQFVYRGLLAERERFEESLSQLQFL